MLTRRHVGVAETKRAVRLCGAGRRTAAVRQGAGSGSALAELKT
jgi:hypothetical protein